MSSSSSPLPSLQEVLAACDDASNESLIRDYFQQLVAATSTDLAEDASTELQSRLLLANNNNNNNNTSSSTTLQVADILMDVIWLHASMIPTSSSSPSPASPHFVTLIQTLASTIPSMKLGFLQSLDPSLLQAAGGGIITSEADLQKKMRMTNTQQFYRQYKFNLLAEESEGYAKFVTFLLTKNQQEVQLEEEAEGTGETSARDYRKTVVQTLIGTFSLDPNRCLDLVLDVMEKELVQAIAAASASATRSTNNNGGASPITTQNMSRLLDILQCLPLDKLPALLAFKLNGRLDDNDKTPTLQCIAFLVLQKCLDLVDMMTFFPEWLEPLETMYNAVRKQEMDLVKAMDRVTLSSSTSSSTADKKKEVVDLGPLKSHLTTRLIHLFLVDWNQFQVIQDTFQQEHWTRLAFLFPDTIGVAICDFVHQEIQPFLRRCQEHDDTVVLPSLSLDNFLQIVSKPLAYIHESGCIMLRPALYCQLCRLCHVFLEEKKQEPQDSSKKCEEFLKTFLLPNLSLFPANPALSREMWRVLQLLPYRTRYRLYRPWRGCGLGKAALMASGSGAGAENNKSPRLISGEIQAAKDARYSLKRLSKDTIRDVSRAVAKVCHSHPLVVFTTILGQIESYDNLVQVMVDAMRFVTPLSLDVLGFCVLGRLSGSGVAAGDGAGVNRSRLKEDGVNVSQWLQSLESFTGALYKRFPFLELRGILSYIMNRLKDGHVMELGVLRTLLKTSGGWAFADYAPVPSLSYTQLEGRAGSTLLKRETMSFGVFEDYNARASNSIRAVLQNDDVGVSLLILLAQVRHQIVFESTSSRPKPVKLIANLVDMCQVTMAILLDFLTDSAEDHAGVESKEASAIKKCAQSMPTLADLHQLYALDVASAWMLCRPLIRAAATALESGEVEDGASEEVEGDTSPLQKFRPTDEMRASFEKMLPESAWSHITTVLFESFYTSALYDIYFPEDIYKAEIMRLEKEAERLSRQRNPPASVQPGAAPTETDAEALERVKKALATLSSDQAKQKKHVAATRESIASKINAFFVSKEVSSQAATTFFVNCVFPRCMQGPDDALFCARFVALLHDLECPGFSTLHFFDMMIVSLSRALFGLTEGEAANVSLLFNETWKVVSRWRYDEDAFSRECEGKPGSLMVKSVDGEEEAVPVSHEEYAALYNKWHAAIGATALGCIRSSEYMHCRNSLIVLTRMLEYYPTKPKLANRLLAALQPLQEESYAFADIRASALAYGNQLVKARDSGVWKEESASDVKARQAKEQEEAAARQKKAEAQMEQIKRDSEKITEEIGEKESRDNRRGDHRGPAWPQPRERGHGLDDGRGGTGLSAEIKTFTAAPGREQRVLSQGERRAMDDRRGPPPRETSGAGASSRDDHPPRDRLQGRGDSRGDPLAGSPAVRREGGRETGQNDSRRVGISLEGRWHRAGDGPVREGDAVTHGSKRSRPSSPIAESTDNNNRDEPGRANKRQRTENTDGRSDEGGGRRSGRRRGGRRS